MGKADIEVEGWLEGALELMQTYDYPLYSVVLLSNTLCLTSPDGGLAYLRLRAYEPKYVSKIPVRVAGFSS